MVKGCASGKHRPAQSLTTLVHSDFFLDLRLIKLRHHHPVLPRYKDVYTLAYRLHTFLASFRMDNYSWWEACDLAVGDQRLLGDELTQDIVTLCDLVRQASLVPVAETWISNALKETPRSMSARSHSTPNDHSANHPVPADERTLPPIGALPIAPPSHRTATLHAPLSDDHRQVLHRICHASERDESDLPPLPPRIAHRRASVPPNPRIVRPAKPSRSSPLRPSPLLTTIWPPLASLHDRLTPKVTLQTPSHTALGRYSAPHAFRPCFVEFCRPCECVTALCT